MQSSRRAEESSSAFHQYSAGSLGFRVSGLGFRVLFAAFASEKIRTRGAPGNVLESQRETPASKKAAAQRAQDRAPRHPRHLAKLVSVVVGAGSAARTKLKLLLLKALGTQQWRRSHSARSSKRGCQNKPFPTTVTSLRGFQPPQFQSMLVTSLNPKP